MDEPTSALDPEATHTLEDLIWELRGDYTILIVTHNMAQARRASEECAFMLLGKMMEHASTDELFLTPKTQETADYYRGPVRLTKVGEVRWHGPGSHHQEQGVEFPSCSEQGSFMLI